MISIHLSVREELREEVIADLWELGTSGVTEESGGLRAFFESDVGLSAMMERFAAFDPQPAEEVDRDWVRESQDQWRPMEVGSRWFLAPEWCHNPTPAGRIRLTVYPGMACGTGWHPATRLCLEAMERWVRPGQRVLDVGTGSGILAHAAKLLDAGFVAGCDIDHESTKIAAANSRDVAVDLFTGSLRSVRSGAVNVVVANLNAATIDQLAAELRRVNARLILAGFREEETGRVCRSLQANPSETLEEDGWACVVISG